MAYRFSLRRGPFTAPQQQGEQTIRLLGPFSFAFNTSGITTGAGVKAFDLEDGQTVIRAWIVNTAFWDGTNVQLTLDVGPGTGDNQALQNAYDPTLGGPYAAANVEIEDYAGLDGSTPTHTRAATATGAGVGIYVKVFGTGITEGTANVYALIAEPA